MGSLNLKPNGTLFCPLRNERVANLPEERVRQALIEQMVSCYGYPKHTLLCEQALKQLPHLRSSQMDLPDCRFDLLCMAKGIHPKFPIYPLLLVECKAVSFTTKTFEQIIGYNYFVKAYYLVVANHQGVQTGWFDILQKRYQFQEGLPDYKDLIEKLKLKM